MRCYGRTVTPLQLKRNEEIDLIKKEHANEMNRMKMFVRSLLKQNNPDLDDEALDMMMTNATANENGATPHSSTSTNIPILEKVSFMIPLPFINIVILSFMIFVVEIHDFW